MCGSSTRSESRTHRMLTTASSATEFRSSAKTRCWRTVGSCNVTRTPMIIGVPKEVKRDEYRVAMLPVGVEELTTAGHTVLIEKGAGLGSGLSDAEYLRSGGQL